MLVDRDGRAEEVTGVKGSCFFTTRAGLDLLVVRNGGGEGEDALFLLVEATVELLLVEAVAGLLVTAGLLVDAGVLGLLDAGVLGLLDTELLDLLEDAEALGLLGGVGCGLVLAGGDLQQK